MSAAQDFYRRTQAQRRRAAVKRVALWAVAVLWFGFGIWLAVLVGLGLARVLCGCF